MVNERERQDLDIRSEYDKSEPNGSVSGNNPVKRDTDSIHVNDNTSNVSNSKVEWFLKHISCAITQNTDLQQSVSEHELTNESSQTRSNFLSQIFKEDIAK